jgi:phospholipase/carboxylesterase
MATIDALRGPTLMPASGKPARSVVVLLHGYGSNGDDLIGLAPFFARILPDTAFYSPNAPQPIEGGFMGGFQWFSLATYDPEAMRRDPNRMTETFKRFREGAAKSATAVDGYLDQILAHHGLAEDRLALLGFSQGTMMALHVGLRRTKQIAGILGFSGALTGPDVLAAEIKSRPPVALVHGDADAVVPFEAMAAAEKAMTAAGVTVETHPVRGLQHGIDGEAAQFGAAFLKRVTG